MLPPARHITCQDNTSNFGFIDMSQRHEITGWILQAQPDEKIWVSFYNKHDVQLHTLLADTPCQVCMHAQIGRGCEFGHTIDPQDVHKVTFTTDTQRYGLLFPANNKKYPLQNTFASDEIQEALVRYAHECDIISAIHIKDYIFNFLLSEKFDKDDHRVKYYFYDGKNSANQFMNIIRQYFHSATKLNILEFASGYGCVSRHLKNNQNIDLVCSDIHKDALSFLQDELGLHTLQSSSIPEEFHCDQRFDVVFALSFFSHMPERVWEKWLRRLMACVKKGGVMLFTTHGLASRRYHGEPDIPASGFWFTPVSEQKDLSTEEYGMTIVTPEYVKDTINTIPGVFLEEMREAYWWSHQDMYVVRCI